MLVPPDEGDPKALRCALLFAAPMAILHMNENGWGSMTLSPSPRRRATPASPADDAELGAATTPSGCVNNPLLLGEIRRGRQCHCARLFAANQ